MGEDIINGYSVKLAMFVLILLLIAFPKYKIKIFSLFLNKLRLFTCLPLSTLVKEALSVRFSVKLTTNCVYLLKLAKSINNFHSFSISNS